ncbi:MAG: DUF5702 domain-containing protein [Roseburia sp.]
MKKILRWMRQGKRHKYINGGKGVISIFLAILMLPFLTMADMLVESARYHDAVAVLDECMDSAGLSTLSYNDSYLLSRFGLLATSQDDISTTYSKYLEDNIGAYGSWDITSSSATGINSLDDTEILYQQVLEMSKFSSPTSLAGDFVISELIDILKQFKTVKVIEKWSTAVSSTGDTADAILTLYDAIKDFDQKCDDLDVAMGTYESTFGILKEKIEALKTALATVNEKQETVNTLQSEIDALDDDDDGLDELKEKLKTAEEELESAKGAVETAKTELETAKKDYSSAISELSKSLTSYQTAGDKVYTSLKKLQTSLEKTKQAVDAVKTKVSETEAQLNTDIQNKENEINEAKERGEDTTQLENEKAALETERENYKNSQSNIDKINTATDTGVTTLTNAVDAGMKSYNSDSISAANATLSTLKTNVDNIDVDSITENYTYQESDFYLTITGLMSKAEIQAIIKGLEDQIKGEADDEFSLWSMFKTASSVYRSLFTTNGCYDSRLDAYLSTEAASYSTSDIDNILADISDMLNCYDGVSGTTLEKIVKCLKNFFTAFANLLCDLIEYMKGVVSRIGEAISELTDSWESAGEKIMFDQYLVKTFPNRTSIKNDSTIIGSDVMTGYSFSSIKLKPPASLDIYGTEIDTIITLLGDIKSGGVDNMFCAAELEYIITGSRSEIVNQTVTFFNLYILRFLVNIPSIIANSEIRTLAEGTAPFTAGMSFVAVYSLYLFVEPLIDTVFLVNGKEVPLIKTKAYLTPAGITAFVTNLSTLNVYNKEELSQLSKDTFAKETTDTSTNMGFLNWKYDKYMLIEMIIFGENDTYLERLQTLITLEEIAKNGEGSFDISKSYTFVKGEASGKYNPILPLGGMANGSIFTISRERVRGY